MLSSFQNSYSGASTLLSIQLSLNLALNSQHVGLHRASFITPSVAEILNSAYHHVIQRGRVISFSGSWPASSGIYLKPVFIYRLLFT